MPFVYKFVSYGSSAIAESPNYPQPYCNNMQASYCYGTNKSGSKLTATFEIFNLGSNDYITFYSENTTDPNPAIIAQ